MNPNELAEAGFYYTGIKDDVRCFSCGCGVKDWDRGDNAWIEHARWAPHCAYLKQCQGEEFVHLCRNSNTQDRQITKNLLLHLRPRQQQRSEENQQNTSSQCLPAASSIVVNTQMKDFPNDREAPEPCSEDEKLFKENHELKLQRLCKICLVEEARIVFLPCGHLVSCSQCSQNLNRCVVCRATIKGKVRAYPA